MTISLETRIADIAASHPASIRVFQRLGLDFCCGGDRPLGSVCAERGLDTAAVAAELAAAAAGPGDARLDWGGETLTALIAHIVERYHGWLWEELPRLTTMSDRVVARHGATYPDMVPPAAALLEKIRTEIEPHLRREEVVLFPHIRRLEALSVAGRGLPPADGGLLDGPIEAMEEDHRHVGDALARLRQVTDGFTPPLEACPTFRGLFHGLAELEREIHEHVHLENNVLFPRAAALERELVAGGS